MQLSILATALLALGAAAAPTCCTNAERREWRTLTTKEKQAYISAVKCLQTKPSQLKSAYPASTSRFDDYQAVHIDLTDMYHFTGPFQAWHRVFLHKYESDLRSLCSYKGFQPYWDWTKDSGSEAAFLAAPVFDSVNGFGGNGPFVDTSNFTQTNVPVKIPNKTGGGCVQDGAFKDMTVTLGPGPSLASNPRCLTRDFSYWLISRTLTKSVVDWTFEATSFAVFDHRVQGVGIEPEGMTIHAGGHLGVGGDIGEIGNMYSSPGDPLFYLHHANLDRLWDQWQRKDFTKRVKDMTGPDTMWAYPFDFFGPVPYNNITLETQLDFKALLGSSAADRYVKIKDVMDSQGANLCVKYV